MKIGTIELDNPLVLAPMAGITQLPLRLLAREHGCALVVSEMVSANGLTHRGKKTFELLKSDPAERPLSVQLFGKEPAVLRDAAQIVQAEGADMVDINLGCSVRKVLKQGAGVALMQDPKRLEAILKAGSYDLGPKAKRIEDPAEWTESKLAEKAKLLTSDKGAKGNFDD